MLPENHVVMLPEKPFRLVEQVLRMPAENVLFSFFTFKKLCPVLKGLSWIYWHNNSTNKRRGNECRTWSSYTMFVYRMQHVSLYLWPLGDYTLNYSDTVLGICINTVPTTFSKSTHNPPRIPALEGLANATVFFTFIKNYLTANSFHFPTFDKKSSWFQLPRLGKKRIKWK